MNKKDGSIIEYLNKRYQLQVFQVFAPTCDSDDEEAGPLYENISKVKHMEQALENQRLAIPLGFRNLF